MINEKIAKELSLKLSHVNAAIELMDEGNTVPFIARYRKEVTGAMSDEVLRDLEERLLYLRNLEERKEDVIRLIDEQGKLTEELEQAIREAEVLQRVEDLYKPYKKKKSTRASKARERGLEPLALIMQAMELESGDPLELAKDFINEEVATPKEALQGAADIIAEIISEDADTLEAIREKSQNTALLVTEAVNPEEKTPYNMYYEFSEGFTKIPNHRILAINRGEKEKKLKVKLEVPKEDMHFIMRQDYLINENSIFKGLMTETIEDSYSRLIAPSIERELRNILTERAERDAVKVFAKNTEKLLMAPPLKGARVLALDPGFRTGCKVAMLDETGKLLEFDTIYPTEPRNDILGAGKTVLTLIKKHKANIIAIGNGTASRETELFIANLLKENATDSAIKDVRYTIVNEAGASIYSASRLATEEYPELDVTTRGALSIGKRLQDPLAELVKISPKHIGVGQYQHDINQGLLDGALTNVVEDSVNKVGVDLNTASPSLLSYIAGVNSTIAKNIVDYREDKGRFKSRKELLKVPKLGDKTFKQCAGFMRISDGDNPLDATAVHPESYGAAEMLLTKLQIDKAEVAKGGAKELDLKLKEKFKNRDELAKELGIGSLTLEDIIEEFKKPGRDPREDMPSVVFRSDVLSLDDLRPDMVLTGTVRNVVDFGAFVDIGVKNDGLVHISQLSHKYVSNPMDVVNVGDTVKVKVLSIDREREKISLSMKR